MTWRFAAASAPGTSHAILGQPCQDHFQIDLLATSDGSTVLAAFVSDGAGSAIHGGIGAELAVDTAIKWCRSKILGTPLVFNDDLAVEVIQAIKQKITTKSLEDELVLRDYACTFLGLISNSNQTLLMQIGDGVIASDFGQGLELPISPMHGEYANMTSFVTDSNVLDIVQVFCTQRTIYQAAILTDGLERLALNMTDKTLFAPFFDPLLDKLKNCHQDQMPVIDVALTTFLESEKINERTDDDKTLVLIALNSLTCIQG